MDDGSTSLLTDIIAHRLPGITLSEESIHPKYLDQSILNVPSSVCQLLDVPLLSNNALRPEIVEPLGTDASTVILILMDALAFHRLQRWLETDESLIWHRLINSGVFAPLTSVVPSTTSACLPSLWTGCSPARLGLTGYEMWLREYGVVANMIVHKPISYVGHGGGLEHAGFDPETFLPADSISLHLQESGVTTHVFQHYGIIGSGLSKMFLGKAERHAIDTPVSLWADVLELVEATPQERKYIWVYWGSVDGMSHLHGPDSERCYWEFKLFSEAFENLFFNQLSAAQRKQTAVILTADHGQITTDRTLSHYDLTRHPEFTQMLQMMPTGENRLAYLYLRPGCEQAARQYIEAQWPGDFQVLDPAEVIANGLFGPGEPHPKLADRIGDLVIAAQGYAYWWWSDKENPLMGRHGGLSREEMIVPFVAARL